MPTRIYGHVAAPVILHEILRARVEDPDTLYETVPSGVKLQVLRPASTAAI